MEVVGSEDGMRVGSMVGWLEGHEVGCKDGVDDG